MNKETTNRYLFLAAFFCALSFGKAQALIIPQIADGGGWQTTIVLTNTSAIAASASLSFFEETGGGATQSWSPAFLEVSSTQNLSLAGGGSLFLHTAGAASATTVGWAQLEGGASVVAYAIFTDRLPGRQDQDGTGAAAAGSSRILVPFDNTNGFITSVALANTSSALESVSVGIQTAAGTVSQPLPIAIPPQGHVAFALAQQFSTTIGQSGLAEFYSPYGNIAALALRFNPSGAFTAAPVYPETGPPIIVVIGSGAGTLPPFNQITIFSNASTNFPALEAPGISVTGPATDGSYTVGKAQGNLVNASGTTSGQYTAIWNRVTVTGQALTFTGLQIAGSTVSVNGTVAPITSATLSVVLNPNPQVVASSGTVTGVITLVSTLATISGSFTGTYTAQ